MKATIDFSKITGRIKPLHGINNSPIALTSPLVELQEAGIPYIRLHDTAGRYGGSHFVDIPNVFPNFDADPDDPASYDFAFTDAYFKQLVASGMEPFYRLGVTIENFYKIKAYEIHPPKDFLKWAKICAGIIKHYNEGWADGFKYGITYWEIWNEPENPPMWTGTREQYFELYRVTANYLKEHFPYIKVGGYAGCGFYAITDDNTSDFYKGFITFFEEFLKLITTPETSAPLDFYSWHLYTSDPFKIVAHANYVDSKLKEYGLTKTESIFDEWNLIDGKYKDCFERMKEAPGAAFVGAAFCLMQKSPIDKAMYYDALPTRSYCGLYYFPSNKVTKTYYSFKAFNELYQLGNEAESSIDEDGFVCAAVKEGRAAALLVNNSESTKVIDMDVTGAPGAPEVILICQESQYIQADYLLTGGKLSMPSYSVVLVRY